MNPARKLIAIALVLLMQGPAMLVQEVAWVNMLVTYTQERGLKRGVIETFDGQHPCEMCKAAEKIRQSENPQEEPAPAKALREKLVWGAMVLPAGRFEASLPRSRYVGSISTGCVRVSHGRDADGPETPPPERV